MLNRIKVKSKSSILELAIAEKNPTERKPTTH